MTGFHIAIVWLILAGGVALIVSGDDSCGWYAFRCNDGKCISESYVCDKWVDCEGGEDEANCVRDSTPSTCGLYQIGCADNRTCKIAFTRCDGDADCPDGSDEAGCSGIERCLYPYAPCEGRCIHKRKWCDGNVDCEDGSDEAHCATTSCGSDSFNCGNGTCVPDDWRCDGDVDCPNGMDETSCSSTGKSCWPGERPCNRSRECIDEDRFCDENSVVDCRDGSDEAECAACPEFAFFRCNDGKCIPDSFVCDHWQDCENGEDENASCVKEATPSRCRYNSFGCADNSSCLSIFYRCDGNNDCPDGSDEENCPTHGCEHFFNGVACQSENECIHHLGWCNGSVECQDGSDESRCGSNECEDGYYNCGNGRCILNKWVGDANQDCPNGRDEIRFNSFRHSCRGYERKCMRSRECVRGDRFCDGNANDCRDGSDEENCQND